MPWSETTTMDLKEQFIRDWRKSNCSVTELCCRYGISRKTGHKWLTRYIEHGPDGLRERSHANHHVHNRTDADTEKALVNLRKKHPKWGAKKLLHLLGNAHPDWDLPAESTACDIFKRNGLVRSTPKRRHIGHPGKPDGKVTEPNTCWSIDFKGQFKTLDGNYCFPLTVTDNFSRYLLACKALEGTSMEPVKAVLTRVFHEYGLPNWMRSDNGTPFAAYTLGRLSKLSVWWIKLGILPDLIQPGRPQQNGKHERIHRTLNHELIWPPAFNNRGQQRKLNAFQSDYNFVRPHEALDMNTPGSVYVPSTRVMPNKIPAIEYPDHFEVRYVSATGGIKWKSRWYNVSSVLVDEFVGLEQVDDGEWDIYFGPIKLGRLHEYSGKIEDHLGSLTRMPHKV